MEKFSVREIVGGYTEDSFGGIKGNNGWLDIRPKYQRGFIYDDERRNSVIDSVLKGYPIGVMYWIVNRGVNYEVLDGQQRIISICRYVRGDFAVNGKFFGDLTENEQHRLLCYQCTVYCCECTDKEKSEWYKILNA